MKSFSVVQAREVTHSVFAAVLDRPADPEALKFYSTLLFKSELTVREMVRQLGHSDEFMKRNLLDKPLIEAVHGLYQRFLARPAENNDVAAGMAARMLAQGWRSQIDWFVNSGEYLMKFGDDGPPR
jgi:hypothetical protein